MSTCLECPCFDVLLEAPSPSFFGLLAFPSTVRVRLKEMMLPARWVRVPRPRWGSIKLGGSRLPQVSRRYFTIQVAGKGSSMFKSQIEVAGKESLNPKKGYLNPKNSVEAPPLTPGEGCQKFFLTRFVWWFEVLMRPLLDCEVLRQNVSVGWRVGRHP